MFLKHCRRLSNPCILSIACRLFSCGTSKEGESYLVEWNESEGAIKRTYNGFRKRSSGVVQFDTTRNRFLAAGDEFVIKFWDMDSTNLLCQIEADGGLPVSNGGCSCCLVLYVYLMVCCVYQLRNGDWDG